MKTATTKSPAESYEAFKVWWCKKNNLPALPAYIPNAVKKQLVKQFEKETNEKYNG